VTAYESSLKIDPDWIVPYHNLAVVYREEAKVEKFAMFFAEAVSLDSNYKGFLKEPGALEVQVE